MLFKSDKYVARYSGAYSKDNPNSIQNFDFIIFIKQSRKIDIQNISEICHANADSKSKSYFLANKPFAYRYLPANKQCILANPKYESAYQC